MQKIAFSQILREEVVRAIVFATTFFVIMLSGFIGVAYAAEGGLFGRLLDSILIKTWDDPTNDGTVRNAQNLGGIPASNYVPVGTNRTCEAPKCIYGFDAAGDVMCR